MRNLSYSILVLAFALPACGGDDGGGPGDGDGGIDAPPPAPLIATWRALPSNFDAVPRPEAARNRLVFGADHSLVVTTDGQAVSFDYTVMDDLISITPKAGFPDAHPEGIRHRIVGDVLLNYSKTPMRPVDGLVNTWVERRTLDGARWDVTWDLRADQTASVTYDTDSGPFIFDATWEGRDGDLLLNVTDENQNPVLFLSRLLDGHLGVPYEILP